VQRPRGLGDRACPDADPRLYRHPRYRVSETDRGGRAHSHFRSLTHFRLAGVLFAIAPADVSYWRLPFNAMWMCVLGADL
jgi:hypothetical protein